MGNRLNCPREDKRSSELHRGRATPYWKVKAGYTRGWYTREVVDDSRDDSMTRSCWRATHRCRCVFVAKDDEDLSDKRRRKFSPTSCASSLKRRLGAQSIFSHSFIRIRYYNASPFVDASPSSSSLSLPELLREGRTSPSPFPSPDRYFFSKCWAAPDSLYRSPYFNPSTGDPLSLRLPPDPRTVPLPSLTEPTVPSLHCVDEGRERRGRKGGEWNEFDRPPPPSSRAPAVEWSRIPFLINANGSRAAQNTDNLVSFELIGPALSLCLGRIDRNGERDCLFFFFTTFKLFEADNWTSFRKISSSIVKGKRKFSISPVLQLKISNYELKITHVEDKKK